MKVYLAAPYADMSRMQQWAVKLREAGHVCTSRWIYGNEEGMTTSRAAQMDLGDVDEADAVISMTLTPGSMFSSGGRHVEFGYALARGKRLIIVNSVGPENIFHELPQVMRARSIEDAIRYLRA